MFQHSSYRVIPIYLVVLIFAATLVAGCPKNDAEGSQPADLSASNGTSADGGESAPDGESTEESENSDDLSLRLMDKGMISGEQLTQKEIEILTGYGPFLFPGAKLMPDKSMRQQSEDAVILNMELGTETSFTPVFDWYVDNLEGSTKAAESKLPTGESLAVFDYESSDGSVKKKITVRGVPKGDATTIFVLIMEKHVPPKEETG